MTADGRPLQVAVPPGGQFSLGLRWATPNNCDHLALSYTSVGDQIARSGYYAYAYPLDAYHYANFTVTHNLKNGWALNCGGGQHLQRDLRKPARFSRGLAATTSSASASAGNLK